MRRSVASDYQGKADMPPQGCEFRAGSGNHAHTPHPEVPDFVAAAVKAGFSAEGAADLYRRIRETGRELRARVITPASGMRRVEGMAVALSRPGGVRS